MKLIPTKKTNSCQICGDTSGKCRTTDNPDLLLCMSFPDSDAGHPDWVYRHPDKSQGIWGIFVRRQDDLDWQQRTARWLEYRKRQEESARQQQQHEDFYRRLSKEQRDRIIRKLGSWWGLTTADRKRLHKRGLSDEQIAKRGYFSLQAFPELPPGIPDNFPGVSKGRLWVKPEDEGIACPIVDRQGSFTGIQIRRHAQDDNGRYKWLGWGGASKLPNGEYPLAYCQPDRGVEDEGIIGLAEGTSFKPQLAAELLGIPVIGAAGGQFCSAPLQLQDYIQSAQIIRLFPDAGDVSNRAVMVRWRGLWELLGEWGKSLQVAWWGQIDKDQHSDIDEGVEVEQIQYLSWEQFWLVAIAHCPQLKQLPSENPDSSGQSTMANRLERWSYWAKSRQLEADIVLNQRYLTLETPAPGTLTCIQSPMGSGKTQWIGDNLLELPLGLLAIGHRNSTLIQSSARWGVIHLQTGLAENTWETKLFIKDPNGRFSLCIDSLHHFAPEHFEGKILVLDEVEATLAQLDRGQTAVKRNRRQIKNLLAIALKRADRVIVCDGNLKRHTVRWLEKISDKPVTVVRNDWKTQYQIRWYDGNWTEGKLRLMDRSPIINELFQQASIGSKILVCSDSQLEIESLDQRLKKRGLGGYRLDSKTSLEPWVQQFLKDPKQWLLLHRPDYFLYSPSADAGIDISLSGYFQHQFCLFFGVLLVDGCTQMMSRLRDVSSQRHVWCSVKGIESPKITRATFPELVKQAWEDNVTESWGLCDFPEAARRCFEELMSASISQPTYQWQYEQAGRENFEVANLRECLLYALCQQHQVASSLPVEESGDRRAEIAEAKNQLKDSNSAEIFQARDITPEEAEELQTNASQGLPWEDRCALRKCQIKEKLPSIETSSEWSPALVRYIIYDKPGIISALYHRWLVAHPDVAKSEHSSRWQKYLNDWQWEHKTLEPGKHHTAWQRVKTLLDLGIEWFLEPDREWSADTEQVQQVCRRSRRATVTRSLMMQLGKLTPVQWVNRLLKSLGYEVRSRQVRVGVDGKRQRLYQLAPDESMVKAIWSAINLAQNSQLDSPEMLMASASGVSHLAQSNSNNQRREGVTAPVRSTFKNPQLDSPEMQTASASQLSHLGQSNINNQRSLGVTPPQPVVFLLELLARLEADENCIGTLEELEQMWSRLAAAITEIQQLERQGLNTESVFDEPDFWERIAPISDRIQRRLESSAQKPQLDSPETQTASASQLSHLGQSNSNNQRSLGVTLPQPVQFLLELLARLEVDENCIGTLEELKQLWDRVSAAITEIHQLERQGVNVASWFDEPDFWERAIPISDRIQQRLESGAQKPQLDSPETQTASASRLSHLGQSNINNQRSLGVTPPQPVQFLLEQLARLEADEGCIGSREQLSQLCSQVGAAIDWVHQLERQGVDVKFWFSELDYWERLIPICERIQQRLESGAQKPQLSSPETLTASASGVSYLGQSNINNQRSLGVTPPQPVQFLLEQLARLEADENCIGSLEQLKQLCDRLAAATKRLHQLERQGVNIESGFCEPDYWERLVPVVNRIQKRLESDERSDDDSNSSNGGTTTVPKTPNPKTPSPGQTTKSQPTNRSPDPIEPPQSETGTPTANQGIVVLNPDAVDYQQQLEAIAHAFESVPEKSWSPGDTVTNGEKVGTVKQLVNDSYVMAEFPFSPGWCTVGSVPIKRLRKLACALPPPPPPKEIIVEQLTFDL